MKTSPIFTDDELAKIAGTLRDQHDRKVTVPVLRDTVAVIEALLFQRLAAPGKTLALGRLGRVEVREFAIPDEPRARDEPAEFFLVFCESDELMRVIENTSDKALFPEVAPFLPDPTPEQKAAFLEQARLYRTVKGKRARSRGESHEQYNQ